MIAAGHGFQVSGIGLQILAALPSPRKKVFAKTFGFLSGGRYSTFFLTPHP
jgi:hypothetical protein